MIQVKFPLVFALGLTWFNLIGQVDTTSASEATDTDNQILIENALDDSETEDANFEFDTQFENLEDLARNPIDLNYATEETLAKMQLLSELQVQALLEYRRRHGFLVTLYELAGVPTFDAATIKKILPYVRVTGERRPERKFVFKDIFKYGRRQLFIRYQRVLEQQKGYTYAASSPYLGSQDRLLARFKWNLGEKFRLGFTAEKDAGEPFFKKPNQAGFDFYSAYVSIQPNSKWLEQVVLGDYLVTMGQGLIAWSGFGTRKGAVVTNIKRNSQLLRPYSSVNEAAFLRGGAIHLKPAKPFDLLLFGSFRGRAGNALSVSDTLDEVDPLEVSSLQISGLHRTESEIADKNALTETTAGGVFRYKHEYFRIGLNSIYSHFSSSVTPDGTPANLYRFSGNSLFSTSVDYRFMWRNLQFYGETAISENGALATTNGFLASLEESVDFAIGYRNFSRNFQTIYGNPFSEGAKSFNEQGIYFGISSSSIKKIKLAAYADIYNFPWLKTNVDGVSKGREYFGRIDYTPNSRLSMYLQVRNETKERNMSENEGRIDYLVPQTRTSSRLHLAAKLSREWELRSRLELTWFDDSEKVDNGFMLYQDIVWTPQRLPIKAQARFAVFDCKDFDTRIYAYENDLLYSFSIPAYNGQGFRYYLNMGYEVNKWCSLWLRFAQTYYTDRQVISSGNEEIQGPAKSDVRVQVKFSF